MFIMGFKIDISRISLSAKSTYMTFEKGWRLFHFAWFLFVSQLFLFSRNKVQVILQGLPEGNVKETETEKCAETVRGVGFGIRCSCVGLCCARRFHL